MLMPMVDIGAEKNGGVNSAVKADAKSGPGHAPQSPKSVKSSGGPGISSEGMGSGCSSHQLRLLISAPLK